MWWIYNCWLRIKMNVCHNVAITREIKHFAPFVYCHGLSSFRTMATGTCKDLASQGFIVFVPDFKDGTCAYWVDHDGSEQNYKNSEVNDMPLRSKQLKIRVEEATALVDEIFEKDFILKFRTQMNLSPEQDFDLDKFVIGGHSFGGITSLTVCT